MGPLRVSPSFEALCEREALFLRVIAVRNKASASCLLPVCQWVYPSKWKAAELRAFERDLIFGPVSV
jgi:hypothetical protein